MTVAVLDDHLLRDVLAGETSRPLRVLTRSRELATTNLYLYRLCKSAIGARGGALTGNWTPARRRALVRSLLQLPDDIVVVPMQGLVHRMAELSTDHPLSTLGAEAIATAEQLDGQLCVWAGDDGPHIRACAKAIGVPYRTLTR